MSTPSGNPISGEQLQEFVKFYEARLNSLTWSLISAGATEAEAQDVAQETMGLALRQWSQIERPHAFVRTIARRILHRSWDGAKRDLQAHRRIAQEKSIVPFDANEDVDKVMNMLQTLPDAQREAFALHADGYTPAEIAAIIGQKPSTVRSNIRHARTKLIALLDHDSTPRGGTDGP